MRLERSSYSPNVLIYMELNERRISLSDLLYNTATLSEQIEAPPMSVAALILSMDGVEQREDIVLERGVSKQDSLLIFSYANPNKINGRHFS